MLSAVQMSSETLTFKFIHKIICFSIYCDILLMVCYSIDTFDIKVRIKNMYFDIFYETLI